MLLHRRDIDGLRTLAVLPVILFHAKIPGFAGGYVGVDIFFVISGFLITSLLLREYEEKRFSILSFYDRRIRRILPALGFMLLVVSIAAALIMLPTRLSGYAASMASAAISVSNIWFWHSADYFAPSSELNPLLHTWSLGVEEQFYVVLPLMIWGFIRLGLSRHLIWLFAVFGLLSLGLAQWLVGRDPVAAFYLLPTRAWELLLGSVLAASKPWKLSRNQAEMLAWAGVLMVAVSIVAYDSQMLFPGVAALVPCAGAGLVIQVGRNQETSLSRILSLPALVFIGLISYSLYLWHWPLLVLPRVFLLRDLEPAEIALSLGATLIMAVISWRYVEQPIRRNTFRLPRLSPALSSVAYATAGMVVFVAAAIVLRTGLPDRVPDVVEKLDAMGSARLDELVCEKGPHCVEEIAGKPKIVLWGDSHALHYAKAFEDLAARHGMSLSLQAAPGCAPLVDVVQRDPDGRTEDACLAENTQVLNAILADPMVRTVVISGRWTRFFFDHEDGEWRGLTGPNGETDPAKVITRSLASTTDKLRRDGLRVFVLGSSPEFNRLLPACLARATWLHWPETKCSFKAGTQPGNPADVLMQHLAKGGLLAQVLRPYDVLCPQGRCVRRVGPNPITIDTDHLSLSAADQVVRTLNVDGLVADQKYSSASGGTMLR